MGKYKKMAFIEAVIIIIFIIYNNSFCQDRVHTNEGLLSSRVYSGILKPESFLIFNFEPLKEEIQDYIERNNYNISLYVLNLRDGASMGIDEDREFDAVSFNKLPVAIIVLRKVEEGKLSMETLLPIPREYRDSSSGTLYALKKDSLSVGELLRYMLQESDNTAFWVLAEQVSLEDGQQLTAYLNYYRGNVNYSEPLDNLKITPKTTGNLFLSLYLSTVLQPEHSELILSYLTNTSFDIKKYAKLPDDITVSQKYGSFYYNDNKFFHSCGILYIEDSRIFYCTMTNGIEKEKANIAIGEIVNKIYNYIQDKNDKKSLKN